jgi:hypothetical protein
MYDSLTCHANSADEKNKPARETFGWRPALEKLFHMTTPYFELCEIC